MDADGNDNTPEWGWCTCPGCKSAALPIWLSGAFPDDADFYLCERHIGAKMNALIVLLRTVIASPRWLNIGSLDNVAEIRVDRDVYERAAKEVWG
jgi:hypothetical protein